jgi:hypothetical protein
MNANGGGRASRNGERIPAAALSLSLELREKQDMAKISPT